MTAHVSLSRSAMLMSIGTILSRITGFGRVFAMAFALGNQDFADTYTLANNIPNIIYELVVGGVLGATLIPVFVREFTTKDDRSAWDGIGAIVTAASAVLIVLMTIVLIGAPWIIDLYTINSSAGDEQRDTAAFLLRLFAPQLLCYGFISLATALLQSKRRFAPPMFAPIFNNIVVICILLALPYITSDPQSLAAMRLDTTALLFLGIGTTAGVFAMASLLIPYVVKIAKGHFRLVWNLRHPVVGHVLRLSGWTAGFVVTNQVALWVTVVLANQQQNGNLAAFLSAYTLFILPHGIFAVSIMSALQPDLSEKWAKANSEGFRVQSAYGLRVTQAIMIPAAVGYALLALPIVTVVLQHGAFSTSDSHRLAEILAWMVIGLPGFSAFIYFTRAFQSMHDARTVFFLYLFENLLNIATAIPLYKAMGVNGLALSQSLAYTVGALVAAFFLRQRLDGNMHAKQITTSMLRVSAASAGMGLVVFGINQISSNAWVEVFTAIPAGLVTYIVLARLVRVAELQVLLRRRMV